MLKNEIYTNLKWENKQNRMYMPNEIFHDLASCEGLKTGQVAFAYSYYYLISWTYRYAKYGEMKITAPMIKEILGYKSHNKDVDYVIKKNGVLDQIGYTETSPDYPVAWNYTEEDGLSFTMLYDFDTEEREVVRHSGANYKIKVPVKGLHRTEESVEEKILDGTYYEIENTHEIGFDVFAAIVSDKELGCIGFYIYSYLKYRSYFTANGKYANSYHRIGESLKLSSSTIEKYINLLNVKGYIGLSKGECIVEEIDGVAFKRRSNTYCLS